MVHNNRNRNIHPHDDIDVVVDDGVDGEVNDETV